MKLIVIFPLFLSLLSLVHADCECGYQDENGSTWTDSIISYFNETNSIDDVLFNPTKSPGDFATSPAGDAREGEESWVAMQNLNVFDTCFTCTYRSGVNFNNTFFDSNSSRGLGFAVQPAEMGDRISYGSQVVTRRRDILYGSLRASFEAPAPNQGGTVFQFTLAYNASDYFSTSIYSSDDPINSTFQWSYSARGHVSQPTMNPLSSLGEDGFYEHRMDWISSDELRYSNDGTNSSANLLDLNRKRDHVNIPSLGGPVNFKHWSNGENSQSQGPPIHHQPVARVRYARLFFNSSLPLRHSDFEQKCASTQAPICSTEDHTLRKSTPFFIESTRRILAPPVKKEVKFYAILAESISGGIFLLFLIHAMINRSLATKRKEREFLAKEQSKVTDDQGSSHSSDSEPFSSEQNQVEFEKALRVWEDPSKLAKSLNADYSDSDSFSDDSDDESDDLEDPLRSKSQDLFSFGHGVFNNSNYASGTNLPLPYTPPSLYLTRPDSEGSSSLQRKDSLTPTSGTQSPISLGGFNGSKNHLSGINDRLLSLKEGETSSSYPRRPPFQSIQRRGSNLSVLSFTRDENEGGFSYSATSYPRGGSITSSRLGSFNELPGVDGSTWNGGLLHGIGTGAQNVNINVNSVTSESQARLIPTRSASYIHQNGVEHPITWDPRIVEWKPLEQSKNEAAGVQLAERSDGVAQLPQAPATAPPAEVLGWFSRMTKKLLVGEGAGGMTASGAAKVEYLDGLRGFACFLVSFHHFMLIFFYNVTTPTGPAHYPQMERWLRNIFGAILTNGGLNVGIFFCLAARVIANRYLVRGRLQDLAEATQRRVPRLMVPITSGIILCYFLIEADAFHFLARLSSRSWSVWSYYQDYDNLGTFLDSWMALWFTTAPNTPSMISTYATGILWTVPLIIGSSWTVFTCALIAYEIPNVKKRYCFYAICFLVSWYALRFDYFFIAGLIIADLDNKVKYRAIAAKGFPLFPSFISNRLPTSSANKRIHGQVFAWMIFLTGAVVSWLDQINGTGSELSDHELGIHPHFQTAQPRAWFDGNLKSYTDPRIFDFFFVIGFFLLCDLCASFRTFFQLRLWSALGRNAFSLYLLHGVIFWSWGAWLLLRLLAYEIPYWSAVFVVFITSYIWLAILCEAFTRTFDTWGVGLSKAFWRETSGGLGRR